MKKHIKNYKGYVLVEIIIALSVLTIAFLSLIVLLNNAIGLSRVVSEYYIATYLAGEGIEIVRNIISTNVLRNNQWNGGLSDGTYEVEYNSQNLLSDQGRFLRFDPSTNIYNYNSGNTTPFKRKIQILNQPDTIKVISTVQWTSRGGAQYSIQLEDYFYNVY